MDTNAFIFMLVFALLCGLVGMLYWRAEHHRWSVWAFAFATLFMFGISLVAYGALHLLTQTQ